MGLIDKLDNEEFLSAAIAAWLEREREVIVAEGMPSSDPPTDEQILAAYSHGPPPPIRAFARLAVRRIADTEPRTTKQVVRDVGGIAKKVHQTIEGGLDFIADIAAPPKKLPKKGNGGDGVRVQQVEAQKKGGA